VHDYDPPPGYLRCAAAGCTSQLTDHGPLTLRNKNRSPLPGTPEDRAHLVHRYDAALAHVDEQLGLLLDDLARLGLAERTLVVVTSDHGEELFERGFLQHGKSLHREVLDIPLIVRVPGRAPARITEPAMQVDVAPTILAALRLPRDPRMQGVDLLAPRDAGRAVWSEVDDYRARQASLRAGGWKLVRGSLDPALIFPSEREWALYDLARDPEERADRSAAEPARLAELRRELETFQEHLDERRDALGPLQTGEVDEATQELLRQLGY
jgi:arylsulfatase A-like enzyme